MADDLPSWLQYSPDYQLERPVETQITGQVPQWLTGTLYRNGSGLLKVGETTMKHLFDGFSVLHKFVIKDGKVSFQHKILDTDTLQKCLKANRLVVTQFATVAVPDPCKNIFSRYFSYFFSEDVTDNTAVNIVPHGDMLIAMTETTAVNVVDPETLTRKERVDLDKLVAVHMATAHPHSDEEGNMYNLGTAFNPQKAYNIIKVPPQEKEGDNPLKHACLIATLPSRWKFNISYNHSFGMSQNYFIVLEQPLTINVLKLPLMKITRTGFETCFSNYSDEKSIIHLASRSSGKGCDIRYVADAFFCFHFINCFEEDDHVVVDLVAFDSGDVIKDAYISAYKKENYIQSFGKVRRYVLPLNVKDTEKKNENNLVTLNGTSATAVRQSDGTILCTPDYVTGDDFENAIMELPRINYSYNTKKYRYVYGSGFLSRKPGLTKHDLQTRKVSFWHAEEKDQAAEPVFVGRPGGTDEDDGVILSPVMPMDEDRQAYLVILDAKSFKEIARAVAPPGVKMPIDFTKLVAVHVATAHPHTDEEGNMYNLGTAFNPKNAYNIIKVPPQENGEDNPLKRATLISTFPSRWNFNISYSHSFGMSQNYFVVLEQPLTTNSLKIPLMKIMGKGFDSLMTYYPDEKLIFHLVRRSDGKRIDTHYVADAFFCFHFINCYEEDEHVVIDLCAYDSGDVLHNCYISDILEAKLTNNFGNKVRRYVLPLNVRESGEMDETNLVTLSGTSATAVRQANGTILCTPDYIREEGVIMELPRINYSYNAKKYRYAYGSGLLSYKSGLTKVDFETRTVTYWKPEEMDQVGEPVFVCRPGSTEEDDGIILSPVLPVTDGRPTYLVALDAKTFKEIARAVIPSDVNSAISFHGSFVPCDTP